MINLMENKEFAEMWQTYTGYLQEDHGIVITKQQQKERLIQLDKMCGNDYKQATAIVEITIVRGEVKFCFPDPNEMDPEN